MFLRDFDNGSYKPDWPATLAVKRLKLEKMSVDELVERFAEIAIAQDQAELMGEIGKFNSLYRQMDATEKELRTRGREAASVASSLWSSKYAGAPKSCQADAWRGARGSSQSYSSRIW
jgi:hypothetical protein